MSRFATVPSIPWVSGPAWPLVLKAFLAGLLLLLGYAIAAEIWPVVGAIVAIGMLSWLISLGHASLYRALIGFAFLAPGLVLGGVVPFRFEDLALLTLLLVWGRTLAGSGLTVRRLSRLFVAYILVLGVATLYGSLRLSSSLVLSDFFSPVAVFRLLIALLAGAAAGRMVRGHGQNTIPRAVVVSATVASVLGLMQYVNLLGINTWMVPLYRFQGAESRLLALLEGGLGRRIPGTSGNPNLFAALLAIGLVPAFSMAVVSRVRLHRLLAAASSALLLLGIILTLSRTGALAAATVLFVLTTALFLGRVDRSFKSRILGFALLGVLGVVAASAAGLTGTFGARVIGQFTAGIGAATSLAVRTDVLWSAALESIGQSPIIGLGPARSVLTRTIDNGYLAVARTVGLVGLMVWLTILFLPVRRALRGFTKCPSSELVSRLWVVGVLLIVAVFGLTADVFQNTQLMGITWFVVGYGLEAIDGPSDPDPAEGSPESALVPREGPG